MRGRPQEQLSKECIALNASTNVNLVSIARHSRRRPFPKGLVVCLRFSIGPGIVSRIAEISRRFAERALLTSDK